MTQLVLSLFPGIGLLDMAFEAEGFCVVRGPDLLWGGDIKRFHPPAGKFDGVIGGPPCQAFSRLVHIVKAKGQTPKENLIPQFERCIVEALPRWFLMENVPDAPEPEVTSYWTTFQLVRDVWCGGETSRERRFTFGSRYVQSFQIETLALHRADPERTVVATSSKEGALAKSQGELKTGISPRLGRSAAALPGQMPRRSFERCCELQGLPVGFLDDAPFTAAGKYEVVGNGVPLAMGHAVAKAVLRATEPSSAREQYRRCRQPSCRSVNYADECGPGLNCPRCGNKTEDVNATQGAA